MKSTMKSLEFFNFLPLGVKKKKKKSCVSTNMLKKIWSVGKRNFFYFSIFSPEKNRVRPVIL